MKLDGVFILAAGYGTRLRPLTHCRPKPCIPVLGSSPLERWLEALKPLHPRMTVLNTHHLPELVQIEWERLVPSRWRYCFSHEPQILDTGGGLREAFPKIPGSGPVLVLNGDVIAEAPIEGLIESHHRSGALCTAWVNPSHPPKTVTWDRHHRVISFNDREKGEAVFCGVYVVEREILSYLPEAGPAPIIPALETANKDHPVHIFLHETPRWCDIGSIEMYWKVHNDPALRKLWSPPKGRQNQKIPAGCLAAGKKCAVERGARLKNVVLWDSVAIGADAVLEDVIVTDGVFVKGNHQQEIISSHGIHPLAG